MPFVAGAIVGNLILDSSGVVGGITSAVAAAIPGGSAIAAPFLAAFDAIKSAAGQAWNFLKETVQSVGDRFDNIGESAEKAGVSTEFLSRVGLAAADAGSSVEGLEGSLKFLNKNIADAGAGNQTAIDSFAQIGVSLADLQGAGGDTEKVFALVAEGIKNIDNPADKVSGALGILGKAGSDLVPTMNLGAEGLAKFAEISDRTGNTVTADQAKAGDAFGTLGTVIGSVFAGIRQAIASPILAAIGGDADNLEESAIRIGETVRAMLPPILSGVASIVSAALTGAQALLGILTPIAALLDKIGATSGAANALGAARQGLAQVQQVVNDVKVQVNAGFDANDSTSQIAAKLQPAMREAVGQQKQQLEGAARRAMVAGAAGGRAS